LMLGKNVEKIAEAHAGDIVAVTKLKETETGDTLCDKANSIYYEPLKFPEAAINFAIQPKSRADEDKLSGAIHKLLDEDPLLRYTRNDETKEFELGGSSQQHVEASVAKLKNRYHVEVELHQPKVPYRETIKARVEVQGRHKKQTGGRGQFGDCKCIFEPLPRGEGFEFKDKIFGGAIPQQWRPAVEKGIKDSAARGALAGYPVVDFKVELIDGSYHTVDSDDFSFQAAGRKAFKNMIEKAHPVLLEPIMSVEVVAPQECSGDIMGEINSRRGRIQGMDSKGTNQIVKAIVPMAEMLTFPQSLNSITSARGSYSMEFSHYDEVPAHLSQKIVQQAVADGRVRKEEEE
jgi:elongation factor G